MKQNIGSTDKMIRISLAALIAILYFMGKISGTTAVILGALALIFVLTSFIGFCPLYAPFGISSKKRFANNN